MQRVCRRVYGLVTQLGGTRWIAESKNLAVNILPPLQLLPQAPPHSGIFEVMSLLPYGVHFDFGIFRITARILTKPLVGQMWPPPTMSLLQRAGLSTLQQGNLYLGSICKTEVIEVVKKKLDVELWN